MQTTAAHRANNSGPQDTQQPSPGRTMSQTTAISLARTISDLGTKTPPHTQNYCVPYNLREIGILSKNCGFENSGLVLNLWI